MVPLQYALFLTIIALVYGNDENCDTHGILIYEDLGCTPEYENGSKCPTKYSCVGLEPNKKAECVFRGQTYKSGEEIDGNLTYPTCDIGCHCRAAPSLGPSIPGISSFTCAILDCPEWLGSPLKLGCYRQYELGKCCSTGQACPPFSDDKCTFEGKDYSAGTTFYPKNSCSNCVCQKGFDGKLEEPFCRRRLCGSQLRSSSDIQKSCAPFYRRSSEDEVLCCPDSWLCPTETEDIKGEAKSEHTCKFGNKVLKVGQYIERAEYTNYRQTYDKVRCECVVPPLLKCYNTSKL